MEGLVAKLTTQVNRYFQNSSVPSSMQGPGRRRVPNTSEPTGRYDREGRNLARRLREYEDSELAFLDHPEVPPDNSRCERLARVFKRRQHRAICFRSMEGLALACDAISVIDNMRGEGLDVFDAVARIFRR